MSPKNNSKSATVSDLAPDNETVLRAIAGQILDMERNTIASAIETGRLLSTARELIPHGQWLPWVKANFEWSARTAKRYASVYRLSQRYDLTGLNISLSALYLMADLRSDSYQHQHDAAAKIYERAKSQRVTHRFALEIAGMRPLYGGGSTPVFRDPPRKPEPSLDRKAEIIARAMNNLQDAVKWTADQWADAVQGIEPRKLRTIIDRLELLYETRTRSRFEDDEGTSRGQGPL